MLKWIPFAMVRVTAFFIAGILVGIYQPDIISEFSALAVFAILIVAYFIGFFVLKHRSTIPLVSGLIGLTVVFLAGYLSLLNKTDARSPSHISNFKNPIAFYLARIKGMTEEKVNSWKVVIEIEKVKSGDRWEAVTGKCQLIVSKKSGPFDGHDGDRILIEGSPVVISPPTNPGEFDLKRFLSFRNISHQHFVRHEQVKFVAAPDHRGVLFYSQKARSWASAQIKCFVPGTQEQAITLALILGVTDGLDNDLLGAYAASGAMHILSVSGLHVGIIYAIILFLVKPLSRFPWSRWLIAVLSLICLWAYAFVTGLSPSVLRAVTMFSFFALARPSGRDANVYNTLAASAFFLLLYDPYLIMSVGFQLSYLAVIGIVYLQGPLYRLWEPASWWWDKVWQVTSVSIVAQLATFALGLFYFHQFPIYFLFSNLIVIPLSSMVLVVGIMLLALSPVSFAAGLAGFVLQFLISLLNGSVFFVEGLPFSIIQGVQITAVQCWLLLGTIVSFILLFEHRKFKFALGTLLFIVLFTFIQWRHFSADVNREQLIVYHVPGHGALEWIIDGRSYFYADSILINDKERLRYHIHPNRLIAGVGKTVVNFSDPRSVRSFSGFRLFRFGKATVLWIGRKNYNLPDRAHADYLIIGNNAVSSIDRLAGKIDFKKLILDSSNSPHYASQLVKEAEASAIPVHSVSQGAFVITL